MPLCVKETASRILKKKKKNQFSFFFPFFFLSRRKEKSTDTHQLKVLESVTQQEFEIENRESLDTLALTEGSSGSRRRSIVRVEGKERKIPGGQKERKRRKAWG